MQRSTIELPSLKRFRTICFFCVGVALCVLLVLSTITIAPSIVWVADRTALFSSIVGLYFLVIAIRTHVMVYQLTRGSSQTFDRSAPEWITVPFLLAAIGVALWPPAQ